MKKKDFSTKKNFIYEVLRKAILTQEFKAGESLHINKISPELEVSPTPVREALILLEEEHLVNFHPNSSPTVCVLDSQIFRNTFDSVLVLLLGSYEFCIGTGKKTRLIENMQNAIDAQKELFNRAHDFDFIESTLNFDLAIIASTENNYLLNLFNNTVGLMTLICLYDYTNNNVDRLANIKEHEAILNAMMANDHGMARNFLHQHYARSIIFSGSY